MIARERVKIRTNMRGTRKGIGTMYISTRVSSTDNTGDDSNDNVHISVFKSSVLQKEKKECVNKTCNVQQKPFHLIPHFHYTTLKFQPKFRVVAEITSCDRRTDRAAP